MWRVTACLLKRPPPPLGLSKKTFLKKLRNPSASKPWRDRAAAVGGTIDVTSTSDVVTEDGETVLGSLTTAGPLGLRSPHLSPAAAREALVEGQRVAAELGSLPPWASPASDGFSASGDPLLGDATALTASSMPPDTALQHGGFPSPSASSALGVTQTSPYGVEAGRARAIVPSSAARDDAATITAAHGGIAAAASDRDAAGVPMLRAAPMAALPFGKALQLNVEDVDTYAASEAVPIHLQHLQRRSKRAVADSILLPRHINKLFHKIMGWSEELVELEHDQAAAARGGTQSPSTADKDGIIDQDSPRALRKKAASMADKMKYGVLLDSYDKDKFAVEHQLEVAGHKMERKMLEWEGVHVLDQDASAEMANVLENKAAIVMEAPASFHVPVPGRDCCSGCGAMLQNKSEHEFGYVRPGEIEKYVKARTEKVQLRHEYAARMAELQAHWEKHGRQVGEEWLDFMTQEEFNAFYRDVPRPFICHRCHALENLNVVGRRTVWSAPDFTDQLRALKEKKCVVVLVVDITDFPGSMVYDLPGLISMNNPVIIAVNKMDCIRNRSFAYTGKDRGVAACLVPESYVRRWVTDIAVQFGLPQHQIKRVVPLSAKRGWGIQNLITAIEETANLTLRRPSKPLPTYFVGVANVGKSSVINAMAHALHVPQPPHPKSKKVYYTRVDSTGKEAVFWRWYTPPNVNQAEMIDIRGRHDKRASKLMTVSSLPGTTVAVNAVKVSLTSRTGKAAAQDESASTQTYFYDTPGLLPHWHQRSPLTLLQMRRTLIRAFRNPQCFILLPGHTLFLGGMAAIDVVRGPPRGMLFLTYTSHKVRNAIVDTVQSNEFWREQLGKALDPPGSYEQLAALDGGGVAGSAGAAAAAPGLTETRSYLFECYGRHRRRPKADVYVCGLGWVSFCVSEPADVVLRVRTLPGVVHGVREPLRYKDLRARRAWPRLKRRFTPKGLEDRDSDVDADSINTVVRLVSAPLPESSTATPTEGSGAAADDGGVRTVKRAQHVRHHASSSAPFAALKESLQASGKI